MFKTNIGFLSFSKVFQIITEKRFTGEVIISWDSLDRRIKQWVNDDILDNTLLLEKRGILSIRDGEIVGAKYGAETISRDCENAFKSMMKLCYGISCFIIPEIEMSLIEKIIPGEINIMCLDSARLHNYISNLSQAEDKNYVFGYPSK